jgi:hypothetical protein
MKKRLMSVVFAVALPAQGFAAPQYEIQIQNHQFQPAQLTIPANTKVKLVVKNTDNTPEEFESYSLHREKIVRGNSQAIIFIGPLEPGEYKFFGEFNPETAKGKLVVK